MTEPTDQQLLHAYTRENSADALCEIARRHSGMVRATALRALGDPHAADDATQAVFLVLMRRAAKLSPRVVLGGWLFTTTRFIVSDIQRQRRRRQRHEQEAARMTVASADHISPESLAPLLNDALAALRPKDREAIVLRYLEERPSADVAAALAVTENTARQRIARALTRLRRVLAKRGLIASSIALAAALETRDASAHALAPALEAMLRGAAPAAPITALSQGVLHMMAHAHRLLLAATATGAAVAIAAGVAIAAAIHPATAPALPFEISSATTVLVKPLQPDGSVDYVAALNERYGKGVKPEENGYVVWLSAVGTDVIPDDARVRVLAMCGAKPGKAMTPLRGLDDPTLSPPLAPLISRWRDEDPQAVAGYFKEVGPFLDRVSAAAAKEKWWEPLVTDADGKIADNYQHGWLRASEYLEARMEWRGQQGDFDGFLADALTMMRLSRHPGQVLPAQMEWPLMQDHIMGQIVGDTAARGKLTAAQCGTLAKAMDSFGPLPSIPACEDEAGRWLELQRLQRIALGKEPAWRDFNRNAVAFPQAHLAEVDWNIVLKQANLLVDERVKEMKTELASAREAKARAWTAAARGRTAAMLEPTPGEGRAAYSQRVAEALMAQNLAFETGEDRSQHWATMYHQMARAVVAAAQYKAETGDWPMKLADLIPAYLHELPLDIYAGDGHVPCAYIVRDAGIEIYSIGPDGRDDGGLDSIDGKMADMEVGVLAQ